MKKLLFIIPFLVLLTACSTSHVVIDWVDFMQINGKHYTGSQQLVISKQTLVKEKIGEVRFEVNEHVKNPKYKIKEGDAAYLSKGTDVYSIEGYPDHSIVAVKDKTMIHGYKLYSTDNAETLDMKSMDKVQRIEVYISDGIKPIKQIQTLTGEEVKQFLKILEEGTVNSSYTPNTSKDPQMFDFVCYTSAPIAYRDTVFFDGEVYYWYSTELTVIDDGIVNYLK
ncbi:hypothetical protein [Heyndrickxia oleronia]|uniref:Lipoprotein n=1 Tax=Heyndrickxia oleronia TaxID=38875 RepID=A0AAW6SZU6_9BACI|nr:hypothetical protein [Heyndrickxia oleronia]MDH5164261.1 hypothetical protein [Heyndrickxia oleronia]